MIQFNYFDLSLIVLIAILSTSVVFISYPMLKEYKESESEIVNLSMCENKTLRETTECLVDYVRTFYNYTIRDDTEKTLEDIKLNGGDCYDWSKNVYEPLAKQLGFNVDTKRIEVEDIAHRFAIIWDKDLSGYCILEQRSYRCFGLG